MIGPPSTPTPPSPPAVGGPTRCLVGLLVVLVVCLGIRVWLIGHSDVIARDGTVYVHMAREISEALDSGQPISEVLTGYDYHPGYPALMVTVHRLWPNMGDSDRASWERAGQAISFVAALGAMVAIWALGGLIFNWRVAWIGALLFGVGRNWAELGADVLSDTLAICLGTWAFVCVIRAGAQLHRRSNRAIWPAIGVGLLGGIGYLVRPETALVAIVAVAFYVFLVCRKAAPWRLALWCVLAVVTSALCVGVPYAMTIGSLTLKKPWVVLLLAGALIVGAIALFGLGRLLLRRLSVRVLAVGGACAAVVALVATRLLAGSARWGQLLAGPDELIDESFEALHPAVAAMACVWFGVYLTQNVGRVALPSSLLLPVRRRAAFPIWAMQIGFVGLLLSLYYSYGYISQRHLMLCAAILAPFAGAGVAALAEAIRLVGDRHGRKIPVIVPTGGIILAVVIPVTIHSLQPLHEGWGPYRQAGEYVGRHAGPDSIALADTASYVKHYGGVRTFAVPADASGALDVDRLRRMADKNPRFQYLVVRRRRPVLTEALGQGWIQEAAVFRRRADGTDSRRDVYVYTLGAAPR